MRFFRRGRKSENTGDAGEAEMTPRTRGSASARGPATSYVRSSQPASFSGRSSSEKYNLRANSSSQPASYTGRSSSETYNLRANNGEDYDVEDSNVNVDRAANKGGLEVDADYNLIIDGDPVYVVKQKRGYLSIFFSLAQTVIVVGMMIQCGVAPMKINPMVGPNPDVLSYWGAKNSYDILYEHEYWRLFSPIMLHAGIFHLLCNVAVQLDTGAFFEREWGSFLWLLIYLGSAAAGTILSVVVSPNTIGVGSSGAVCGLFGAKMAEAICRSRESTRGTAKELSHAILCEQCGSTLCSVILILVFSFIPYVDWAAHVGGLLGGFVMGFIIFSLGIESRRWKTALFSMGCMIALVFYGMGVFFMIKERKDDVALEMEDVCKYYQGFFEDYECNCQLGDERWKTALFSMGCMIALVFYGMGVFFMIKERKDDVALEMEDVCKDHQGFFEDYECNCQLGDE